MDTLAENLLKELECPVCLEYIMPPIAMCENGHSICTTCRQKLLICPTCRQPFSDAKCLALENLARRIKYPCKFRELGCEESFLMQNIASHQADCPYKPFKCPFSIMKNYKCPWEGHMSEIEDHIKSNHTEPGHTRSVTGKHNTKMQNVGNLFDEWWQAIFSLDEVFFLYSRIRHNSMYFCILYVGPTDKASNYRYRISINKSDMSGSASACHVTCSYLTDVEEMFRECDCAVFQQEYVKKCMDQEKCLLTEVEIFRHFT
jgi:E3 ubiquitin-protein ligase SIAH1